MAAAKEAAKKPLHPPPRSPNPLVRERLLTVLEGAPDVLDALLQGVGAEDPRWDARPDPCRFTLREIVAHLADWESIWHERVRRTRDRSRPRLRVYDEGRLAEVNGYADSDVCLSRSLFRQRRVALVETLRALRGEAQWLRAARHPECRSPLTLETQVLWVLLHDGYHLRQIAEWLAHPCSTGAQSARS